MNNGLRDVGVCFSEVTLHWVARGPSHLYDNMALRLEKID